MSLVILINYFFIRFSHINSRINKSVNNLAQGEGGEVVKLWAKPCYRSHMIAAEENLEGKKYAKAVKLSLKYNVSRHET